MSYKSRTQSTSLPGLVHKVLMIALRTAADDFRCALGQSVMCPGFEVCRSRQILVETLPAIACKRGSELTGKPLGNRDNDVSTCEHGEPPIEDVPGNTH